MAREVVFLVVKRAVLFVVTLPECTIILEVMMPDESIIRGTLAVNIARAAAYLDLSEGEVWALIDNNVLPVLRVTPKAKHWIIPTDALHAYGISIDNLPYPAIPYIAIEPAPTADDYWPAVPLTLKTPPGVYVLQSDRYFKIGCSDQPSIRVMNQAGATPFPSRAIALLRQNNPVELEGALHLKFARKRMNGEWFRLDDDDVRYLRRLGERMETRRLQHVRPARYKWSDIGKSFVTMEAALDYLVSR